MKTANQRSPDEARGAGRDGAPEPTSQPALIRRRLELPDGRYELAYERSNEPAGDEVGGDA